MLFGWWESGLSGSLWLSKMAKTWFKRKTSYSIRTWKKKRRSSPRTLSLTRKLLRKSKHLTILIKLRSILLRLTRSRRTYRMLLRKSDSSTKGKKFSCNLWLSTLNLMSWTLASNPSLSLRPWPTMSRQTSMNGQTTNSCDKIPIWWSHLLRLGSSLVWSFTKISTKTILKFHSVLKI